MKTVHCAKCGKEIKDGQPAIAITDGEIDQAGAEGFRPDTEQYIAIYCGNCCNVSEAVDNVTALLAACKMLASCGVQENGKWVKCAPNDSDLEAARAAIAKAEGR